MMRDLSEAARIRLTLGETLMLEDDPGKWRGAVERARYDLGERLSPRELSEFDRELRALSNSLELAVAVGGTDVALQDRFILATLARFAGFALA